MANLQMRWQPFDLPSKLEEIDFIEGLNTIGGAGDPKTKLGLAIHVYSCNIPMNHRAFYNADGDFLLGTYFSIPIIRYY